jgi:hypothetical protein
MKAALLHQCPHLARWGLGSNKVRVWRVRGLLLLLLVACCDLARALRGCVLLALTLNILLLP